MVKGVLGNLRITVSYIRLNRACTTCTCWWNL